MKQVLVDYKKDIIFVLMRQALSHYKKEIIVIVEEEQDV